MPPLSRIDCFKNWNSIADGATPKLIASASESSCLPSSEQASNSRAANPSLKSNTAASNIRYAAHTRLFSPSNAKNVDNIPQNALEQVNRLGTNLSFLLNPDIFM